jgi:hypothetical protein
VRGPAAFVVSDMSTTAGQFAVTFTRHALERNGPRKLEADLGRDAGSISRLRSLERSPPSAARVAYLIRREIPEIIRDQPD